MSDTGVAATLPCMSAGPGATPPTGPADPSPIPPAQIASAGPDTPAPPGTPRGPFPPAPGASAPSSGPARGSVLARWLVEATGVCGEWSALTISATTRTAVVLVPDEATFLRWCNHLNIPKARRSHLTDPLGDYTQGVTTARGWTVTVHLADPLPQQESHP
jgi:hypothetical protein